MTPWKRWMALILVVLTALLCAAHLAIFREPRTLGFYLLLDFIFMPLQVLLVSIVLDSFIARRERTARAEKLNMVMGAFFSEVGTPLLERFARADTGIDGIRQRLLVRSDWGGSEFALLAGAFAQHGYAIDLDRLDLEELRAKLVADRPFLLALLENPNLLEHDAISDMLWAVFHLAEELMQRRVLRHLLPRDAEHLANDVKRAYSLVARQWVSYLRYLSRHYPYLFSLVVRTNPFDPAATAEVR